MKRLPTLWSIVNEESGEVINTFAVSELDLATQIYDIWQGAYSPAVIRTCELLTPEGYHIYRLKDLPKGTYFCRCQGYGTQPTAKTVWVRGEYNRSARKYEIYKFEDVNHTALRRGDSYVTIDMTF